MTSRLEKRREVPSSRSLSGNTHTHEVRGTGREDQVPARAVADIEGEGMIDFKFPGQIWQIGAHHPGSKRAPTNE